MKKVSILWLLSLLALYSFAQTYQYDYLPPDTLEYGTKVNWVKNIPGQKIILATGYLKGDIKNGPWKYYEEETGKISADGRFIDGKRIGVWKYNFGKTFSKHFYNTPNYTDPDSVHTWDAKGRLYVRKILGDSIIRYDFNKQDKIERITYTMQQSVIIKDYYEYPDRLRSIIITPNINPESVILKRFYQSGALAYEQYCIDSDSCMEVSFLENGTVISQNKRKLFGAKNSAFYESKPTQLRELVISTGENPKRTSKKYFDINGNLWKEEYFKNGHSDSIYVTYYSDGTKSSETFYIMGKPYGYQYEWFEDGSLHKKTFNYIEPENLNGYPALPLEGEFSEYYRNGKLHFKGIVRKGEKTWSHPLSQRDGQYSYFDKNGQLYKQCTFILGKLIGAYKELFPNGKLKIICEYKLYNHHPYYIPKHKRKKDRRDNRIRVRYTLFFKLKENMKGLFSLINPAIYYKRLFISTGTRLEGLETQWYENGNKKSEGFYRKGQQYGKWNSWSEDGTIFKTEFYPKKIRMNFYDLY
jgi:antitoxin component YwqK of YwqJK toxin-antitoxin module